MHPSSPRSPLPSAFSTLARQSELAIAGVLCIATFPSTLIGILLAKEYGRYPVVVALLAHAIRFAAAYFAARFWLRRKVIWSGLVLGSSAFIAAAASSKFYVAANAPLFLGGLFVHGLVAAIAVAFLGKWTSKAAVPSSTYQSDERLLAAVSAGTKSPMALSFGSLVLFVLLARSTVEMWFSVAISAALLAFAMAAVFSIGPFLERRKRARVEYARSVEAGEVPSVSIGRAENGNTVFRIHESSEANYRVAPVELVEVDEALGMDDVDERTHGSR